jgi:formate dehydrogenase subunit delta
MSSTDLARMVNQIAVNQSHLPADEAAAVVAQHLTMFWAPAMRRDLLAAVESGDAGLNEVALRAVRQLQPV